MSSSEITISAGAQHLIINEVDYDMVGGDNAEFIEIYNPSNQAVSLAGKAIVLLNGSSNPATEYPVPAGTHRITLDNAGNPAGMLPAGGYLVIGAAAVTPMGAGIKYTPPVADWPASDAFQNGSPDGLALIAIILAGMGQVWNLAEGLAEPWGLGLGILGNGYIASGLIAASMRFYRERIEFLKAQAQSGPAQTEPAQPSGVSG